MMLLALAPPLAIVVCLAAAMIWPPRCSGSPRLAIGETMLVAGCR